jgi:hypothetical protein
LPVFFHIEANVDTPPENAFFHRPAESQGDGWLGAGQISLDLFEQLKSQKVTINLVSLKSIFTRFTWPIVCGR